MTRKAGAIALLAIVATIGCKQTAKEESKASPIDVRCVKPTRAAVSDTVALRGRLSAPPGGDLEVASQVPGKIAQVMVHEGQRIEKGDVIATIDDTSSRDALRQANAAVVQARAAKVNADATFERTKALVAKGIAPKQELDDALARSVSAKGALDATIAAADLARRTLGRVAVRSTFGGTLTRLFRGEGALVDGSPSTPIAQLSFDQLQFLADATQRELATIALGQAASGEIAAGPDAKASFDGKVGARSSAIDVQTGLGFVRIALTAPTTAPIGAYGRVVVVTGKREGVLFVPSEAIRGSVSDGVEIVICKEAAALVRTAKIGYRDDKKIEIVSGLEENELVALDHVLGLETGTAIHGVP